MINATQDILDFWFSDAVKPQWFKATAALDQEIRDKYQALWQQARQGELDDWLASAESALALVFCWIKCR